MCFEAVPYLENCDWFWTLLIYHAFYFFGTFCWTLTDNMGGGGVNYILCFLFSFSLPCKVLFASLCNILFFATFWTLLIYHAFYLLTLAVGLPLISWAGGMINYILCLECNQCCAIKTKACLFFASRRPAISWALNFSIFLLIDAGDNSWLRTRN